MDKSRRHPVGLIIAGLAVLAFASWVFRADFALLGPDHAWTQALTVVITLGAVAVLALRNRPFAMLTLGVALAGLAITTVAVVGYVIQYQSGFPGKRTLLAAIGGLAVAIGALVIGRWRRPAGASAVFGLVAFLLVPAVAAVLLVITPDIRMTATTAAPGPAPAVPTSVSKVAWSIDVDGEIEEAAPAGMGVVVRFGDRVIGVDGSTGATRWTRRWHGARTENIDVSPDGRTVLLQIMPAGRYTIRREVLDAFTGELRFAVDRPGTGHSLNGTFAPLTNTSYIGADDEYLVYSAFALSDGRKLWDYPVPAGCRTLGKGATRGQMATGEAMLLPMVCGDKEFRYVSVDGATGRERWQHPVRFDQQFSSLDYSSMVSPDHKLVTFWLQGSNAPHSTLDTETGKPVTTVSNPLSYGLAVKDRVLVDVRSGQVIAETGPVSDCARTARDGLLSRGAVCVSDARKAYDGVRDHGTIELSTVRFGDSALTPLQVKLGGPFVDNSWRRPAREAYQPIVAPGALVMYGEWDPREGSGRKLVGLR